MTKVKYYQKPINKILIYFIDKLVKNYNYDYNEDKKGRTHNNFQAPLLNILIFLNKFYKMVLK